MLKKLTLSATLIIGNLYAMETAQGHSTILRASELSPKRWNELRNIPNTSTIIEFQNGDRLPISFKANGDFFETLNEQESTLLIKKPFFIKINQDQTLFSLDGTNFVKAKDIASGTFNVSFGNGSENAPASAIEIWLEAFLK